MRLVVATVLALLAAGPAEAATVDMQRHDLPAEEPAGPLGSFRPPVTKYTLQLNDAAGEPNRLTIEREAERIVVREAGNASLTAGERCEQESAAVVVCRIPVVAPATTAVASFTDIRLGAGDDELAVSRMVVELVDGGDGADTVTGAAATRALGGPGDDRLIAEAADGGPGNDTLAGKRVDGGEGDDAVDGGPDTDELSGGPGTDTVRGHEGDDVISGGEGADALDGGAGLDVISFAERTGPMRIDVGATDPGGDGDRVTGFEGAQGGAGPDQLTGTPSADVLRGSAGDDRLVGGAGADQLLGGEGADTLDAGDGDDVAQGEGGDDLLLLGAGRDRGSGGEGDDALDGGPGGDEVRGDWGRDVLEGSDGDDHVDGGAGIDTAEGGPGNDTVIGGSRDSLSGGPGRDLLLIGKVKRFSCGTGRDLVWGRGLIPRDCERVNPITLEGCELPTRPPLRGGALRFPLPAFLGPDGATRVRLRISADGKLLGTGRRAIREGRRATVLVRLSASAQERLRRARRLAIEVSARDDSSFERGKVVIAR